MTMTKDDVIAALRAKLDGMELPDVLAFVQSLGLPERREESGEYPDPAQLQLIEMNKDQLIILVTGFDAPEMLEKFEAFIMPVAPEGDVDQVELDEAKEAAEDLDPDEFNPLKPEAIEPALTLEDVVKSGYTKEAAAGIVARDQRRFDRQRVAAEKAKPEPVMKASADTPEERLANVNASIEALEERLKEQEALGREKKRSIIQGIQGKIEQLQAERRRLQAQL